MPSYLRVENLRIGMVPFDVDYAYWPAQGSSTCRCDGCRYASASQIYWLAERVASALDTVSSRRPVTYVLVGEGIKTRACSFYDLIKLGRVVHVTGLGHVSEELRRRPPVVIDQGDDAAYPDRARRLHGHSRHRYLCDA